ncbi:hypothetical protein AHiyo8_06080 [Arthrobacter sp. Hiyo8]|nr:hypothetical protein AHiyo8_06080 [Arthrobacter sp. Hiyo8]
MGMTEDHGLPERPVAPRASLRPAKVGTAPQRWASHERNQQEDDIASCEHKGSEPNKLEPPQASA